MRARDLVGLGRFPYTGLFGTLNERDETVVERSLKMAGAAALAERLLHELSDGERQKVLIARALAQEPKSFFWMSRLPFWTCPAVSR